MALIDQYTVSQDATFQKRIEVAIIKAAIDVANEATSVPNHTSRLFLAHQVLGNSTQFVEPFSLGVASDATIDTNSSDTVISTRVAAIWDAYASRIR